MKKLAIVWQRLVSEEGKTCDRCGATQTELDRAVKVLQEVLRPLDIEPVLENRNIDDATFRADPSLSNRIEIDGTPMEEWLDANVGSSPCCSVCGDAACRTVQIGHTTFETIPERLVVRAGLIAAAHLLD